MIQSIQIKNFKSIVDLSLDLGTFNVLIGENGCGKSNILEAVAFGAASSADKLDYEFLGSRGIRITNPEFMFSAFTNGRKKKSIAINFTTKEKHYNFDLVNDSNNLKKWTNRNKEIGLKNIERLVKTIFLKDDETNKEKALVELNKGKDDLLKISEIMKQYKNEFDLKEFRPNDIVQGENKNGWKLIDFNIYDHGAIGYLTFEKE